MTPVALLPPPPCGSQCPEHPPTGAGPTKADKKRRTFPKRNYAAKQGPQQHPTTGTRYVTTGTGPTEAHQDGPLKKETTARADPRQHPTTGAGHT